VDRNGAEQGQPPVPIGRVLSSSAIGTAIEWYDFFIYGTAAALVFNELFFPTFDPLVGTLLAFSTFAVGFLARPLGGIVFGHFGDRIGRKAMLVTTLLMMGIATFAVGLMPSYQSIGIWAPVGLVVLRFFQGIAVGGEWGGATLMAMEYAPTGKRGFYAGLPQAGVPVGLLLSTGAFAIMSAGLTDEQFASWGWRVPFLISVILIGVGFYIRLKIEETPEFARVKESGTQARMPIIDVVRMYPKNLLLASGARVANNAWFYLLAIFILSYGTTELGLDRGTLLRGVLAGAAIGIFTIPAYAALSDRIGRRTVFMAGAACMALFAFPLFWLVDTGSPVLILLALVIGFNICHDAQYGPQGAYMCELFGPRVRYTGASLAYQLTTAFVGGLTPLIATALLAWTGGDPWPVATLMIVLALISLVALYLSPETSRIDISETRPEERQLMREARARPGG
jgi:MHS family shikimate/dehydroshikimate transporter-like MFS transporter